MSEYSYVVPLDIVQFFKTPAHVKEVLDSCAEELIRVANENKNNPDYIPPIVYSEQGKAFNIHYNFLISSIAYLAGNEEIYFQLKMDENEKRDAVKTAQFLVMGLLEDHLELLRRMNTYMMDCSKYKGARPFQISRRFFNRIVIGCGDNERVFSAVPFDAVKMQGLMDESLFLSMKEIASNPRFTQVCFGEKAYLSYRNGKGGEEPNWVF